MRRNQPESRGEVEQDAAEQHLLTVTQLDQAATAAVMLAQVIAGSGASVYLAFKPESAREGIFNLPPTRSPSCEPAICTRSTRFLPALSTSIFPPGPRSPIESRHRCSPRWAYRCPRSEAGTCAGSYLLRHAFAEQDLIAEVLAAITVGQ
jgi:hypothetical protein